VATTVSRSARWACPSSSRKAVRRSTPITSKGDGRSPSAAPLWLRAVSDGRQRWRLFSYAFQADFLPPSAAVHVWPGGTRQGDEMAVTSDDLVERTDSWINGMRDGTDFIRDRELR
jgi:hypothetical protein